MFKLIAIQKSATRVWSLAFAVGLSSAQIALAQAPAAGSKPAPAAAAPPAQAVASAPQVPMPDNSKLTLLIQMHITALSQANLTGNYTVLHALGSPAFQAANPPAKLAENFNGFRAQAIDISPALLFAPILVGPPKMEANNLIRVTGFYDTKPQRIVFELAFQPASNAWRLADIAVRTVVPQPAPAAGGPVSDPKAGPEAAAAADPKAKGAKAQPPAKK